MTKYRQHHASVIKGVTVRVQMCQVNMQTVELVNEASSLLILIQTTAGQLIKDN